MGKINQSSKFRKYPLFIGFIKFELTFFLWRNPAAHHHLFSYYPTESVPGVGKSGQIIGFIWHKIQISTMTGLSGFKLNLVEKKKRKQWSE